MDGLSAPIIIGLIGLLLFLSAIFSGSETGLYSISRVKLRYRLQADDRRARLLDGLLQRPAPAIITILIGNNLAAQLMVTLAERGLQEAVGTTWSVILSIVVLTPLVLVLAEFLPKFLFRHYADRWMDRIVVVLTGLRWLLDLPVVFIQGITSLLQWLIPGGSDTEIWEPHTSRPNLRTFFKADTQGHSLTQIQRELLDRVLAMERVTLAYEGVTKPIGTVATLDAGATVGAVRNNLGPKYYQRYLVQDHASGKPVGYTTAVDLVTADDQAVIADLLRPLPSLPAATPLHEALQGMHDAGTDLALVPDVDGIAFRGDCLRVLANLD